MSSDAAWTEVTYFSDGLKIAANLYVPGNWQAGSQPRGGIVVLHGYSGMKDVYGMQVPAGLWRAGFFVLAIDNRGFGKSEGVKGRVNPFEQAQDLHDAVTYLETVPGVDPGRIGVYGTSWGGGLAIWSAAVDERIKVVVSSVGIHDGERWMRETRSATEWAAFKRRFHDAGRRRVSTGAVERIEFTDLMVVDPHTAAIAFTAFRSHPAYFSSYELQNVEWCERWRPIWVADRIAPRPVMIIYAEDDRLVPPEQQLDCYEACGDPKKLLKLPRAQHYDSYALGNPELATFSLSESVEWYRAHL